jgi:hypothetical protein
MTKKQLMLGSGGLLVAALLLGAGALQMYQVRYIHSESPLVVSIAKAFGMDMAKVDGKNVPYSEYLLHTKAERTFLNSPMALMDGSTGEFGKEEELKAFDRALRVAAVDSLARRNDLNVTSADIDTAFDQLIAQASSTNPAEIEAFLLEQFGWTVGEFKQFILRPAIIEESLRANLASSTGSATAFDDALAEVLDKKTKRYLQF